MKVSAKTKDHPDAITIEYDMPSDLAGLVEKFGEDVVESSASAQIVISLQAAMRRMIGKGKDADAIQDALGNWRPDVRQAVTQTAFEKVTSQMDKLSPEDRAELLRRLQG